MTINKSAIAYLCFAWCVFLLLGISVGVNLPFVLAVIGSVLFLI